MRLGPHDPFSCRAVLDPALSTLALCRAPFGRGHPSASAFFRHAYTSQVKCSCITPQRTTEASIKSPPSRKSAPDSNQSPKPPEIMVFTTLQPGPGREPTYLLLSGVIQNQGDTYEKNIRDYNVGVCPAVCRLPATTICARGRKRVPGSRQRQFPAVREPMRDRQCGERHAMHGRVPRAGGRRCQEHLAVRFSRQPG
jgi:hypothetical protein